eukprot:6456817-Amphidinium_carterae.1
MDFLADHGLQLEAAHFLFVFIVVFRYYLQWFWSSTSMECFRRTSSLRGVAGKMLVKSKQFATATYLRWGLTSTAYERTRTVADTSEYTRPTMKGVMLLLNGTVEARSDNAEGRSTSSST